MSAAGRERLKRVARWGSIGVGAGLAAIGLRFALQPDAAARAFGIAVEAPGFGLHNAIALRDLWLGVLAIGLALLAQWRALGLWMGIGAIVCVADSAIAARSGGGAGPVAFHLGAAAIFAALASAAWRLDD